ncbi:uncharacterized protein LOC129618225 [Condylostylus longicornis]|uniref:uncharacterized protein LOC129618225 n=1 Tax=Condylostylus longicornis TaxID=2530218 RepID=UPI00244D99E9|nr:uncharacterized protein LOC129618225 [Condylostylus longicornis]
MPQQEQEQKSSLTKEVESNYGALYLDRKHSIHNYRGRAAVGCIMTHLSNGFILLGKLCQPLLLIRYDKDTGQSKGFAFCEYEDAESCSLAVKHLHGTVVGGIH